MSKLAILTFKVKLFGLLSMTGSIKNVFKAHSFKMSFRILLPDMIFYKFFHPADRCYSRSNMVRVRIKFLLIIMHTEDPKTS